MADISQNIMIAYYYTSEDVMEDNKSMEVFAKAPIRKAVLQNALPAMAAMLMVLIYNLADTFFIG